MHNVITATIGGLQVEPLAFNIKTDIESYCWQGSIDITAKDYERIKHKLDVESGKEPIINVVINNVVFSIIAEEAQRNRQFVNHTHTLSGRSITAKLGADYANTATGLLEQANYASQIVAQQLNGQPVDLADWKVPDWLIPANEYSITGKTPIQVISDIAKACGGFVYSDKSQAQLSLKPKWKKPAWELSSTPPDAVIPADIILKIADTKRTNPRYNTVTLTSDVEGGIVYREQQARDLDAPVQSHALYTARESIIAAGLAVMSDSGRHNDYALTMLWSTKYDIPLATPGDIWQINDTEGAFRGVIKGVSIKVELIDDAPIVSETVEIDRYMDI